MAVADEVYKFFKQHIRPFSINEVIQNVSKDFGKAAIQKALDKLVSEDKILEKIYSKQKIYCYKYDENTNINQINNELLEINRQINEVESNLKETTDKLTAISDEEKNLTQQMTLEEAKLEKRKLVEEIDELKVKLEKFKDGSKVQISESEMKNTNSENEVFTKEFRKRKRMCMDMINAILEGYPKTKKHLLEEVGVETDEDVGFQLNQ